MPEIETERLILRPYRRDDIDDLVQLLADYDVSRYLAQVPYPYTRADAEAWIDRVRDRIMDGRNAVFAVGLRTGARLIGALGLHPTEAGAELGYWLGKAYWDQGYASEAVRAVVDFGFTHTPTPLIHAAAHLENRASSRVLEKAGFRYVGDQIRHTPVRGDFPSHRYELTRGDWERKHGGG